MLKFQNKLIPCFARLTDIQFFRFNVLFDFILFMPIIVMIPFSLFAFAAQIYYTTFENPFFFSYAIIRIFMFVMIFFIVSFQYSLYIYKSFQDGILNQENNFLKMVLEFILFLILNSWSLYLGVGFFQMIEKHKDLYDDNVSIEEDDEDIIFEKF